MYMGEQHQVQDLTVQDLYITYIIHVDIVLVVHLHLKQMLEQQYQNLNYNQEI